jgi:hypothetical protein
LELCNKIKTSVTVKRMAFYNKFGTDIPGDFRYSMFPYPSPNGEELSRLSSFGNVPVDFVGGAFRYSMFPYPSPNGEELSQLSSFGKKKKKTTLTAIGFIRRPSGSVVKVYKKTVNGKVVKVLGNHKRVNVRVIYKTEAKAKSG